MGIPKEGNKTIIMVVVYRLTTYSCLHALPPTFTPSLVAQVLLDQNQTPRHVDI